MIGTLEHVSDDQFARYAELIYDKTGIHLSAQKKTLLSNRLRRRLRATGIEDFDSYASHLLGVPASDPEWDAFLQEITTHETYLFRDQSHWDWFAQDFIPEVVAAARSKQRQQSLRIWSAACSTGDEACTVATCLAAHLPGAAQWDIEIFGSDIGVGAVDSARQASFGERAMRLVPDELCRRFFRRSDDGKTWAAKPILTDWTRFEQHNLLHPLKAQPFDVIFLKNVLIYFNAKSKATVLKNIHRVLRPGGMLVTAAAEGVAGLVNDLEKVKPWLYRKPLTNDGSSKQAGGVR